MKKTIALFTLVILLFNLSACSRLPKLDASNPITVSIWNYYVGEQKKAFDDLVHEFNDFYGRDKGIIVESYSKADIDTLVEEINASFNNEPGSEPIPDSFFTYSDSAYSLAEKGLLADFDSYLPNDFFKTYVDGFIEEGRFLNDKKEYILPIVKSTEIIMANQTELDKFYADNSSYSVEVLKTWEGIIRTSEAYYNWTDSHTDTKNDGKSFFGIDSIANFIISTSKQLGIDVMYNDNGVGKINLDSKVLRKLWDTYYINTVKGYFGAYGRFRSDDAKTGDLVAYLGSTTSGAYFPKVVTLSDGLEQEIECSVFKMPYFEDGEEKVAIQQGAGIALSKSTPKREYAMSIFLKWLTEAERNTKFSLNASYVPVTKEAISNIAESDEVFKKYEISPIVTKVLTTAANQINSGYKMYLTKPFNTSYQIRIALETALDNFTTSARTEFLYDLELGLNYEEAINKYISEEKFIEFSENMQKSIVSFISK